MGSEPWWARLVPTRLVAGGERGVVGSVPACPSANPQLSSCGPLHSGPVVSVAIHLCLLWTTGGSPGAPPAVQEGWP